MDIYTIYSDVNEGVNAKEFVTKMSAFLDALPSLHSYRITRMKLGFRSMDLPEFRIDMEFKNMQDLDDAMKHVVTDSNDTTLFVQRLSRRIRRLRPTVSIILSH